MNYIIVKYACHVYFVEFTQHTYYVFGIRASSVPSHTPQLPFQTA